MLLSVLAPAKVNLYLQVLGKRADGYHELLTVFQAVDLCDVLHVTRGFAGLTISAPKFLPQGKDNLVYRAAYSFYEAAGYHPEVYIHLEKNIPVEAGLGGGSSDAAAVLYALNRLYDFVLSEERLSLIAANLGSDVPFFLHGGTAIGRGRGELIEQLPDLPTMWLRLVKPPFGLSTASVYRAWGSESTAQWLDFLQSLALGPAGYQLFNDLEAPAFTLRPELQAIKEQLYQDGAAASLLAGSGTTVFGLYTEKPTDQLVLPEGYRQWVVSTLTTACHRGKESEKVGRKVSTHKTR